MECPRWSLDILVLKTLVMSAAGEVSMSQKYPHIFLCSEILKSAVKHYFYIMSIAITILSEN